MQRRDSLERILDRSIQRLLEGRSWDDLLPRDPVERIRMEQMMVVAELLHRSSLEAAPPGESRKRRVMRRVSRTRMEFQRLTSAIRVPPLVPAMLTT